MTIRNLFFEHIPDPVQRLSPERIVLQQNAAARDPGVENVPCYRSAFSRDTPCEGCLFPRVVQSGSVESFYVVAGEGTRKKFTEVMLIPVRDETGEVSTVFEILRDATHKIGLEQHLIQNAENLEGQVETRTHELLKLVEDTRQLEDRLASLKADRSALVQTDKMAAIGRLAAGLSHELHTPLGALLSGIDTLGLLIEHLASEASKDPEMKKRCESALNDCEAILDVQSQAANRIAKIVGSLQKFAHLDRAVKEDYDIHEGIEATLALLEHRTRGRIDIHREFGALPQVRCRPDALNQVFMNLIENSVAAIDKSGSVRIETSVLESDRIRIVIQDSGSGIPTEQLEKIFEAGFTTKARGVGTGLGLAVSAATIYEHKGKIHVESKLGEWTRFTIELPIRNGG